MTPDCTDPTLLRFRAVLSERVGIAFDDDRLAYLHGVMSDRARQNKLSASAYCELIAQRSERELGALADVLTVSETYFFRNAPHFDALRQRAIPECLSRLPHDRPLRVLSAACASGEEPYSIAILLSDLGHLGRSEILGFDLSPASIERARQAVYSTWSLRETSDSVRARWFLPAGLGHALDPAIRDSVRLTEGNLMREDLSIFRPAHYDIVLCRNALMYLTPEATRGAVARLARSLVPGGFLFLGHAETLRGVSQEFHLCHTHGTFYYQRKGHPACDRREASVSATSVESAHPAPTTTEPSQAWFDSIHRASARIAALSPVTDQQSQAPAPATDNPSHGEAIDTVHARYGAVLELMRQDLTARALEVLRTEHSTDRSTDTRLLEAALLLQNNDLPAAERAGLALLAVDELNAGAHYILALCEERRGALDGAMRHDEIASYLDPNFAMPHVHLGLMRRRAGQLGLARDALMKACVLLAREDATRLILFGGGFDRDALLALCNAELTTVEARRA